MFLQIILNYRLLQDNGYKFLCYILYSCCLSILYTPQLFVSSSTLFYKFTHRFFLIFLDFSVQTDLFSPFHNIFDNVFFSYLAALTKTSSIMVNRNNDRENTCLSPQFSRNSAVNFTIEILVEIFYELTLMKLRKLFSIPSLLG